MYASDICAEGILVSFLWWPKNYKSRSKIAPFFKWAPFWNLISKKENDYIFSEENCLNYTKRHYFACANYIFPETRANKNEQWTRYSSLKLWNVYWMGKLIVNLYKTTSSEYSYYCNIHFMQHDITSGFYSPEKWLHNWIATGPNKSKKLTRLTSPAHTTHGKVRINPLEIWVMQRASKQRSSRCDHGNSGPVVRFNGWTQLSV